MRNLNRMVQMLNDLNEVVKAKGVNIELDELERHLDIFKHGRELPQNVNHIINKLEIEKDLNGYNGLANAIKMAVQYEQQQEVD